MCRRVLPKAMKLVNLESKPESISAWFPGFPGGSSVKKKNLPAMQEMHRRCSLIPESGRSLGGGHGNPLQYSCLENLVDRVGCKESDTTEATELTAQHTLLDSQASMLNSTSDCLLRGSLTVFILKAFSGSEITSQQFPHKPPHSEAWSHNSS